MTNNQQSLIQTDLWPVIYVTISQFNVSNLNLSKPNFIYKYFIHEPLIHRG